MTKPLFGWAHWKGDENWSELAAKTREDAIVEVLENNPMVEQFCICEVEPHDKLPVLKHFHPRNFLEEAEERAAESPLGYWEDNVFEHSELALTDLELVVGRALEGWLRFHPGPYLWKPANITEHSRWSVCR